MNDQNLHKEIDLIQAVVTRMAQNAFYIKGWAVSLVAVVLALGKDHLLADTQRPWLFALVLTVWCAFWYLDAYFLRVERMYRLLYEFVISHKNDRKRLRYDLNAKPFAAKTASEGQIMVSPSLRVFYGVPALLLAGLWLYFWLA